jgi:hypothetical protein
VVSVSGDVVQAGLILGSSFIANGIGGADPLFCGLWRFAKGRDEAVPPSIRF